MLKTFQAYEPAEDVEAHTTRQSSTILLPKIQQDHKAKDKFFHKCSSSTSNQSKSNPEAAKQPKYSKGSRRNKTQLDQVPKTQSKPNHANKTPVKKRKLKLTKTKAKKNNSQRKELYSKRHQILKLILKKIWLKMLRGTCMSVVNCLKSLNYK